MSTERLLQLALIRHERTDRVPRTPVDELDMAACRVATLQNARTVLRLHGVTAEQLAPLTHSLAHALEVFSGALSAANAYTNEGVD